MEALVATITLALYADLANALPPQACFANFRWDDCGRTPEPVMYYWKLGSRCEVGMWRGCLPNINMFKDEYECVSTCIFSVRARASDFHSLLDYEETTQYDFTSAVTNETESTIDSSTGGGDGGEGGSPGGDGASGGSDGGESEPAEEEPAEP